MNENKKKKVEVKLQFLDVRIIRYNFKILCLIVLRKKGKV